MGFRYINCLCDQIGSLREVFYILMGVKFNMNVTPIKTFSVSVVKVHLWRNIEKKS